MRVVLMHLEDDVTPYDRNPRKNDHAVADVAASLAEFGACKPIVVDEDHVILAGHTTRLAAISLGWTRYPVHVKSGLSDAQKRAYRIADNRTGELAEWDDELLGLELADLDALGYDLELTGFDIRKAHALMAPATMAPGEVPEASEPPQEPRTQAGDVWHCGPHRVVCGDSRDPDTWAGAPVVDLVVTSPPYNVGKAYDGMEDRAPREAYLHDVGLVMHCTMDAMADGRVMAWNVGVTPQCAPWAHAALMEAQGWTLLRQLVWKKAGVPKPIYQNSMRDLRARHYVPNYRHELIYLASKGEVDHGNPTEFPEDASDDVWEVSTSTIEATNHPAAFPVELAARLVTVLSAKGEVVCDPYGGTGTTLMAAHCLDRVGFTIEQSPAYVDVIIERWQTLTGDSAVHADGTEFSKRKKRAPKGPSGGG